MDGKCQERVVFEVYYAVKNTGLTLCKDLAATKLKVCVVIHEQKLNRTIGEKCVHTLSLPR